MASDSDANSNGNKYVVFRVSWGGLSDQYLKGKYYMPGAERFSLITYLLGESFSTPAGGYWCLNSVSNFNYIFNYLTK